LTLECLEINIRFFWFHFYFFIFVYSAILFFGLCVFVLVLTRLASSKSRARVAPSGWASTRSELINGITVRLARGATRPWLPNSSTKRKKPYNYVHVKY
jgi:hypothetical protein